MNNTHWPAQGICLVAAGALAFLAISAPAKPETTIQVLFLGDNGHHRPAEWFKRLQPALATPGIELIYTDKLDDLNPATLAKYDCLMIYANHTSISPEQEKALLDFVEGGQGLVAIH